jgi:hypothetical protein
MRYVLVMLALGCTVFTAEDERPEGGARRAQVRVVAPPAVEARPREEVAPPVPAPAPAPLAARHVLVRYRGAVEAPDTVTRGRAEARTLAERALERVKAGEDLASVARDMSEAEDGERGGDLGLVRRGRTHPALEGAITGLPVGGVSDVVESPYGFHVIERYR